ncbi:hypothetical protein D9M68_396590 [compost metagenome]
MAESEAHQTAAFRLPRQPHERIEYRWPRAPGDMEARHRIAVAMGKAAAALGPADDRKPAHAEGMQPAALFACGKVEIGFRPKPRPVVLRTVELRRPQPVLPGKLTRVTNAHAPLLGAIDEEQTAQRPESLTAKVLFAFLIENDDLAAKGGRFRGGNQAGKARTDDQYIAIHEMPSPAPHTAPPYEWLQQLLRVRQGQFKGRALAAVCFAAAAYFSVSLSSMRRFWARASGVSPGAIG